MHHFIQSITHRTLCILCVLFTLDIIHIFSDFSIYPDSSICTLYNTFCLSKYTWFLISRNITTKKELDCLKSFYVFQFQNFLCIFNFDTKCIFKLHLIWKRTRYVKLNSIYSATKNKLPGSVTHIHHACPQKTCRTVIRWTALQMADIYWIYWWKLEYQM